MRTSSLDSKTIRPGLTTYNFYSSNRRPVSRAAQRPTRRPSRLRKHGLVIAVVVAGLFAGVSAVGMRDDSAPIASQQPTEPTSKVAGVATTPEPVAKQSPCATNPLGKQIFVSIKDRKLWACEGTKEVHKTAVITGKEKYASTETPEGVYKIYAKATKTRLTGSDETGSWDRPVDYWMPFLDNVHGTYGFHDATWRPTEEFGTIDPFTSENGSHGCVELPHASQKWLYEWAPVGTQLTIKA